MSAHATAAHHGLVALQLAKPHFGRPDTEHLHQLTLYAHGLGIDAFLRDEESGR